MVPVALAALATTLRKWQSHEKLYRNLEFCHTILSRIYQPFLATFWLLFNLIFGHFLHVWQENQQKGSEKETNQLRPRESL
jgi:hypothetical protein